MLCVCLWTINDAIAGSKRKHSSNDPASRCIRDRTICGDGKWDPAPISGVVCYKCCVCLWTINDAIAGAKHKHSSNDPDSLCIICSDGNSNPAPISGVVGYKCCVCLWTINDVIAGAKLKHSSNDPGTLCIICSDGKSNPASITRIFDWMLLCL